MKGEKCGGKKKEVGEERGETGGGMRREDIGGDEDIDQSTGQGQPNAPTGPISLHTYERFYRDPYKWSGLNLT